MLSAFTPTMFMAKAGGAGAYTGPGDIVSSALGWWGLRGYNGAYASPGTNKAINLRRSGGSSPTSQDFNILSNGHLDVASIATFKAADQLHLA